MAGLNVSTIIESLREAASNNPLRLWRQQHGVGVVEFSQIVRASTSTVQKWEMGTKPSADRWPLLVRLTGNPNIEQEYDEWLKSVPLV